jgi:hypothetical protein
MKAVAETVALRRRRTSWQHPLADWLFAVLAVAVFLGIVAFFVLWHFGMV